MRDLLMYVILGLLEVGRVEPCDDKIAGEDAWRICVELDGRYVMSRTFLRSELLELRDLYRDYYICVYSDSENALFEKLFNVL